MLSELSIDDLVLIAKAHLSFAPGLNVITGETGAGKTLLAQAVGLLLGEKGEESLVRQGAERALVQAVFERAADEEPLAVARRIARRGRSRAYLNGVVSSAAVVEATLRDRIAFYGQLEQTKLLQLERQLDLLDASAAEVVAPLLAAYGEAYARAQGVERRLEALRARDRDRAHELDLLRFEVDEIEGAALEPGEDERVSAERERLRHAEKLLERVTSAMRLLSSEQEGGALDNLRLGERLVGEAASLDTSLGVAAERLTSLSAEAEDVYAALRDWVDDLDVDPAHRDAVELRHDKLQQLKRKYRKATIDEVLAYEAEARQRLAQLESAERDESALTQELDEAQRAALAVAARLSAARADRAPLFAKAVEDELRELAMPHARFAVELTGRAARAVAVREGDELSAAFAALGPRGADEAEFLFSANPGVPLRPLRETASGGELSRAMLAIRGTVTLGNDVETLIFDEVDSGIGGVTATAVGQRLANAARRTQIVCITHLPQIVAFAERHFAIEKVADLAAETTETEVHCVEGEERVRELCRMLGASPDDAAARAHAQGLLERAREAIR